MSSREYLYKIVEVMTVTDESLEDVINETQAKGWDLDEVKFAMRDSSKRPSMAFLFFTQPKMETDSNRE